MPVAREHKRPKLQTGDLFTQDQINGNLEMLRQELEPMRQAANLFFVDFVIPPVNGRPAQCRSWLIPGVEQFDDLRPERVDFVLKHLAWFKEQIAKKHELLEDPLPWL